MNIKIGMAIDKIVAGGTAIAAYGVDRAVSLVDKEKVAYSNSALNKIDDIALRLSGTMNDVKKPSDMVTNPFGLFGSKVLATGDKGNALVRHMYGGQRTPERIKRLRKINNAPTPEESMGSRLKKAITRAKGTKKSKMADRLQDYFDNLTDEDKWRKD